MKRHAADPGQLLLPGLAPPPPAAATKPAARRHVPVPQVPIRSTPTAVQRTRTPRPASPVRPAPPVRPEQAAAPRPHGPTRARQPAGDLQGPPPGVSRQVHTITLTVAQLDGGRWRLTQPRVPGWAAVVGTPGELAAATRRGFTEAQVVAHSTWRGHVYDAQLPTYRRSRPMARSRRRCDVYDPTEWRLDPDHPGKWISPKGHRYAEDRQAVQRVMAARVAMGLPARPDPAQPDPAPAPSAPAGSVTSMTARRVDHLTQQRGRSA